MLKLYSLLSLPKHSFPLVPYLFQAASFLRSYTDEGKRKENAKEVIVSHDFSHSDLLDKARRIQNASEREQFAAALKDFMKKEKFRRGHVKFIQSAIDRIEEFNLEKDILTYNRLLDVFPKNRFKSRTLFDAVWPKPIPQIDVALRILQKMEENGIRPDYNTYSLLCEIFGRTSFPVQKCVRIAVCFDKYENIDPYKIKGEIPSNQWEISKLALQRIFGEACVYQEINVCQIISYFSLKFFY